uniref:Uncharacterized protein n=1 Tax=Leersia perrieri TaxID=77586 RepID=A0A0D9XHH1_9ORYZ
MGFPSLKEFVLVCSSYTGRAYLTLENGAMPKLEKLDIPFHISMAKSQGANHSDTEVATAAIRKEANVNPNHPRLAIVEAYTKESSSKESDDMDEIGDEQGVADN